MALKIEGLEYVEADDEALSDLLNGVSPEDRYVEDPDPQYEKPSIEDRIFPDSPKVTTKRVTQAVRKDVRGKIAMLLTIGGTAWASRDPHCGGTFVASVPDQATPDGPVDGIATALTDLVCDSPDVVKWFTTSGRYMKWLTLAMAVQPVLTTVFNHHVSHTISDDDSQPDWSGYGSG